MIMISEQALKNNTNGLPASPSFPVAIPSIEQRIISPEEEARYKYIFEPYRYNSAAVTELDVFGKKFHNEILLYVQTKQIRIHN